MTVSAGQESLDVKMLTPKQTIRLFQLCTDVLAIQQTLPQAPPSVDPEIIAAALLPYLHENSGLLVELGELLQSVKD